MLRHDNGTALAVDSLLQYPIGGGAAPAEFELVQPIPFQALCEEHLLPFHGAVHIGYLRNGKPLKQAEFTRIVEACSSGIQVQQRMATRIGLWVHHELAPYGVGVLVEGAYACAAAHTDTTTLAFYGAPRHSAEQQRDFVARTSRELVKLAAE